MSSIERELDEFQQEDVLRSIEGFPWDDFERTVMVAIHMFRSFLFFHEDEVDYYVARRNLIDLAFNAYHCYELEGRDSVTSSSGRMAVKVESVDLNEDGNLSPEFTFYIEP